ncbi:MAG: 30S ribosomal protein S19e [Candidatus Micrarchaeota archaeon]|nr:30S ribosomal protein S19e [Candidatus Micrarchaeota archaeon]
MANVFDVDGSALIKKTSEMLKDKGMAKPEYTSFVKSGAGKERVPADPDFYFVRAASLLRQVYINGPVGIARMRTRYGTRKLHTIHRHHHFRSGGSVIKDAFDSLEKLNYVKKTPKGRVITPTGKSFLDKISNEIIKSGV